MGRYPGLYLGEASGGGCCFLEFLEGRYSEEKANEGEGGGGISKRFTGRGVGEAAEDSGRF